MISNSGPGLPRFQPTGETLAHAERQRLDSAVGKLQSQKDSWAALPLEELLRILDELVHGFLSVSERWVSACLEAKGWQRIPNARGEEWAAGPFPIVRMLRQLGRSLSAIRASGKPRIPGPVVERRDGRLSVQVFPQTLFDRILFSGLTAEVWMDAGVSPELLRRGLAEAYREDRAPGKVCLVLGAGNVSSIGPLDVLSKLFVERRVVLLKANPVNAYLAPLMEEAFASVVKSGFVQIATGDAAAGAYLCAHEGVDEIHITGSDKTFEAIVFGPGTEGAARKSEGRPLLRKRITGELGNVSPMIVVPGAWSHHDLRYHAVQIASTLANNAGFNCNATRLIIQQAGWPLREALIRHLRESLTRIPSRRAYYPGAEDRLRMFLEAHPGAERFGSAEDGRIPWTLIRGLDPANTEEICFRTEAFCALFAETALEASGVDDYLSRAVEFANDRLWGTLSATLLVHPGSLREPKIASAVERAIEDLRYGTVSVNYWSGASFALGVTPWGGCPGQSFSDIQSGVGVVHNSLMLPNPRKTVLRSRFRIWPTPPWFLDRTEAASDVFRRLTELEASPSFSKLPGIFAAALRG